MAESWKDTKNKLLFVEDDDEFGDPPLLVVARCSGNKNEVVRIKTNYEIVLGRNQVCHLIRWLEETLNETK